MLNQTSVQVSHSSQAVILQIGETLHQTDADAHTGSVVWTLAGFSCLFTQGATWSSLLEG